MGINSGRTGEPTLSPVVSVSESYDAKHLRIAVTIQKDHHLAVLSRVVQNHVKSEALGGDHPTSLW